MILCRTNPSKMAVEVAWLLFFVMWSTVVTAVMATDLATVWGDWELMTLGVGLAGTTWAIPAAMRTWVIGTVLPKWFGVVLRPAEVAYALQHYRRDLKTMWLGVTTLSLALNYLMTPFFFDVLHMRFGFHVTWTIDRNPIFLYWMTVAYFSTYSVLGAMLYRWSVSSLKRRPRQEKGATLPWFAPRAICMRLVASVLLAFLETLLMANPMIEDVFCYDDILLTLTFGSLCYGVSFVFAIWSWTSSVPESVAGGDDGSIANKKKTPTPRWYREGMAHAVLSNAAAAVMTAVCLHYIRLYVAPLVTTVVDDSPAFGGCLLR